MNSTAPGQNANLPAPVKAPPQDKPKKSGMSKFLAILNCCKAPEAEQPSDSTEPSRKVERPSQSTQSTPPQKSEIGLKEKEAGVDERRTAADKATGSSALPKSTVTSNEKKLPAGPRDDGAADSKPSSNIPSEVLAQPSEKSRMDKPLPASPKGEETSKSTDVAVAAGVAGTAGLAGAGAAAALNSPDSKSEKPAGEDSKLAAEEQVISDRTPEQAQRDEDIEMKDTPPSVPLASSEVPTDKDALTPPGGVSPESNQQNLPPPPPVPASSQENQTNVRVAEPQVEQSQQDRKWLLPALRPEMKGRKCLVLDLDETLVHSSFKVCLDALLERRNVPHMESRFYIKPILQYQ